LQDITGFIICTQGCKTSDAHEHFHGNPIIAAFDIPAISVMAIGIKEYPWHLGSDDFSIQLDVAKNNTIPNPLKQ
jgi:hypothetical protein